MVTAAAGAVNQRPSPIPDRRRAAKVQYDVPVLASALVAMLALQAAQPETTGDLPVSVDRVRAGLARPPAIVINPPMPTVHFRVEVKEHQYFTELPPIDFGTGPRGPELPFWMPRGPIPQVGTTPALAGVDLLALGRGLAKRISAARRASAEQAAREEVQRALREFCATSHECEVR